MMREQNPWETIRLSEYENHMGNVNVQQTQMLNYIVKEQLKSIDYEKCRRPVVAIMGITSGNGLEHVEGTSIRKIIGIDINEQYLCECTKRFEALGEQLELHRVNMMVELERAAKLLEKADLVLADLLIEHIHLDNFIGLVKRMRKRRRRISCVIQFNPEGCKVSASGYEQCFDNISNLIEEEDREELNSVFSGIGYRLDYEKEYPLVNGKSLIRMDFVSVR